jgi:hypothetical protein
VLPGRKSSGSQSATLPPLQVQVIAREGLLAKARVLPSTLSDEAAFARLQVGQPIQEFARVVPRGLGLTVALDGGLERIERVDAISALSAVPHVSSAIAGDQPADYLFSKIPTQSVTQIAALPTAPLPAIAANGMAQNGYGLFSIGRDVLPNTAGEGGEAVKVAVRRLAPKLQTLLASKLLNLTLNDRTSQLDIRASLDMVAPRAQSLLQRSTGRLPEQAKGGTALFPKNFNFKNSTAQPSEPIAEQSVQLAMGSRIRYGIENQSDRPIYTLLLAFDSLSNLIVLHAATQPLSDPHAAGLPLSSQSVLPTKGLFQLPIAIEAEAGWTLPPMPGMMEFYLICSTAPFAQTGEALGTLPMPSSSPNGIISANPVEVSQAILQDLHQASSLQGLTTPPDAIALDVRSWATFRFTVHVV